MATALAEHYAVVSVKIRNLYPQEHNRAQTRRQRVPSFRGGGHPYNTNINAPFTLREMFNQLEQCKDSAPGPDGIMISMVEHPSVPAKSTLLTALNNYGNQKPTQINGKRK